jgi:HSP20 family protein
MNKSLMNRRAPTSIWDVMSEVERVFDEALEPSMPKFQPQVDVKETDDFYLIAVDLPGVNKNQVKVDYNNGRLTIAGERTNETKIDKDKFHRVERLAGHFERSFQLPQDVNADKIQARYEDGVLEVLVPKSEVHKGRSIPIEGEKQGLFSKRMGNKSPEISEQAEPH